jgi:hypothetical protein
LVQAITGTTISCGQVGNGSYNTNTATVTLLSR